MRDARAISGLAILIALVLMRTSENANRNTNRESRESPRIISVDNHAHEQTVAITLNEMRERKPTELFYPRQFA
jgi:hypothetical protein